MTVKRNIILKDPCIFVVKLTLEDGDIIPEHHANAYVTATVLSGSGVFTVEGKENFLNPGTFISMLPNEKHSIKASTNLEIIVHHITLGKNEAKKQGENLCNATI